MSLIRVIDFETSGAEPPEAQVCEVGYTDIFIGTDKFMEIYDPVSWLCMVDKMPPEVRAIHHIRMEDLAGTAPFSQSQLDSNEKVFLYAAHNADYELKFFNAPKPMICTYKASLRLWPEAPSHKNAAIVYWLEDNGLINDINRAACVPTHRAGPDSYLTALLMVAIIETGVSSSDLIAWTNEHPVLPKCPIGAEWRGKPWSEVDAGFLRWMINQETMEDSLKWNARRELNRRSGRE